MVIFKDKKHRYRIDGYLKSNLDIIKEAIIGKDLDFIFIVDGMEGAGKSVLAMQMAYYLDRKFSINNLAFTPEQFKEKVTNVKRKYQAIVFDEAFSGLYSRTAMTYVNISIVSMLAEIRQKNLFIFVVLPTFFDLDRYVAIWRSRALVHVYFKEGFNQGNFCFFNTEKKKSLYMKGYKSYNYNAVKSNFYGNFPNYYTVDEKEYRKLKLKNLRRYRENQFFSLERLKIQRDALIKEICELKLLPKPQIARIINCSTRQIARIARKTGFATD